MRDILKTGSFIIQTRELHKAVISAYTGKHLILIILIKYMEEYALRFNKGKERHITKEYKQLSDKMQTHTLKASRTYRMQMSDYSLGMSMRN